MGTFAEIGLVLLLVILFKPSYSYKQVMIREIMIPLSYAYSPESATAKFPIVLSFNQSQTYTPFVADSLMLYSQNISMDTLYIPGTNNIVIGLKSPSTFIYAVKSLFAIKNNQVEFGLGSYPQLLINYNNFVESTDSFQNGGTYDVRVQYNFGGSLNKGNQICTLIDSETVFFDELLILEILNGMNKRNEISFTQNMQSRTIELTGKIENFPKISLMRGKSIFQLTIKGKILSYLPRSTQTTESKNIIGLKALKQFSKFSINEQENTISFKRTSQLYQLYIFLGYYFFFILLLLVMNRKSIQDTMFFIRNVIKWIFMQDDQARVRVLRTQLE